MGTGTFKYPQRPWSGRTFQTDHVLPTFARFHPQVFQSLWVYSLSPSMGTSTFTISNGSSLELEDSSAKPARSSCGWDMKMSKEVTGTHPLNISQQLAHKPGSIGDSCQPFSNSGKIIFQGYKPTGVQEAMMWHNQAALEIGKVTRETGAYLSRTSLKCPHFNLSVWQRGRWPSLNLNAGQNRSYLAIPIFFNCA